MNHRQTNQSNTFPAVSTAKVSLCHDSLAVAISSAQIIIILPSLP